MDSANRLINFNNPVDFSRLEQAEAERQNLTMVRDRVFQKKPKKIESIAFKDNDVLSTSS